MNIYEMISKRFNLEPRGKGYANHACAKWLVIFDKEKNSYVKKKDFPKAYVQVSNSDEAFKVCLELLKEEGFSEDVIMYNSLNYNIVENCSYHYYINFNSPKSKKQIEEILNDIKLGKLVASDLAKALNGVEESDLSKLTEATYYSELRLDIDDEEEY